MAGGKTLGHEVPELQELFVRKGARGQSEKGIPPFGTTDRLQVLGHERQAPIPGLFFPRPVFPFDHGVHQTFSSAFQDLEPAFVAELAPVGPLLVRRELAVDPDQRLVLNADQGGTEQSALGAQGVFGLPVLGVAFHGIVRPVAVGDGACGTDLETHAAPVAGGLLPAGMQVQAYEVAGSAIVKIEDMGPGNLRTGPHAPPAQNAAVVVNGHVFAGHIRWKGVEGERHGEVVHPQIVGQRLKLAVSALGAEHAVVVSLGEEELQDRAPAFKDPVVAGDHLHALPNRRNAARRKLGRPVHLHDTHATSSPVGKSRMMT